jgi:hypothetical protein
VDSLFQFVLDNKEWIFSGIGVFLLGVLVSVLIALRRRISKKHPATFETNKQGGVGVSDKDLLDRITHISKILQKNYSEQILDEITTLEMNNVSKAECLTRTISEIKKDIVRIESLDADMDSPIYQGSTFGRNASSMIKAASTFAQMPFEEILKEIEKARRRSRSDTEILEMIRERLVAMKVYRVE